MSRGVINVLDPFIFIRIFRGFNHRLHRFPQISSSYLAEDRVAATVLEMGSIRVNRAGGLDGPGGLTQIGEEEVKKQRSREVKDGFVSL